MVAAGGPVSTLRPGTGTETATPRAGETRACGGSIKPGTATLGGLAAVCNGTLDGGPLEGAEPAVVGASVGVFAIGVAPPGKACGVERAGIGGTGATT